LTRTLPVPFIHFVRYVTLFTLFPTYVLVCPAPFTRLRSTVPPALLRCAFHVVPVHVYDPRRTLLRTFYTAVGSLLIWLPFLVWLVTRFYTQFTLVTRTPRCVRSVRFTTCGYLCPPTFGLLPVDYTTGLCAFDLLRTFAFHGYTTRTVTFSSPAGAVCYPFAVTVTVPRCLPVARFPYAFPRCLSFLPFWLTRCRRVTILPFALHTCRRAFFAFLCVTFNVTCRFCRAFTFGLPTAHTGLRPSAFCLVALRLPLLPHAGSTYATCVLPRLHCLSCQHYTVNVATLPTALPHHVLRCCYVTAAFRVTALRYRCLHAVLPPFAPSTRLPFTTVRFASPDSAVFVRRSFYAVGLIYTDPFVSYVRTFTATVPFPVTCFYLLALPRLPFCRFVLRTQLHVSVCYVRLRCVARSVATTAAFTRFIHLRLPAFIPLLRCAFYRAVACDTHLPFVPAFCVTPAVACRLQPVTRYVYRYGCYLNVAGYLFTLVTRGCVTRCRLPHLLHTVRALLPTLPLLVTVLPAFLICTRGYVPVGLLFGLRATPYRLITRSPPRRLPASTHCGYVRLRTLPAAVYLPLRLVLFCPRYTFVRHTTYLRFAFGPLPAHVYVTFSDFVAVTFVAFFCQLWLHGYCCHVACLRYHPLFAFPVGLYLTLRLPLPYAVAIRFLRCRTTLRPLPFCRYALHTHCTDAYYVY